MNPSKLGSSLFRCSCSQLQRSLMMTDLGTDTAQLVSVRGLRRHPDHGGRYLGTDKREVSIGFNP